MLEKEEVKINDFIKNPILIKNSYNYEKITEKILKQLMLEDIENFMKELETLEFNLPSLDDIKTLAKKIYRKFD